MINAHKLKDIPFHASPNVGGVMSGMPTAVVIHYTANQSLSSAVNWLCDPNAKASAHIVIGEGGDLVQLVPFNQVAWHAGRSDYQGRSNFNQFSIGIELVNPGQLSKVGDAYCAWFGKEYPQTRVAHIDNIENGKTEYWCAYTQAQIESLKQLTLLLKQHYPIQWVLGHEEISPGRKRDPGPAFPMESLRRQVLNINRHEHDSAFSKDEPVSGKVIASRLNFRSSINGSPRSGPLMQGQSVFVLEEQLGWFKVQVQETGWVKKEFINVLPDKS